MRFRTLEIRWHDSKPISTCDFQPAPLKRARPPGESEERYASHSYRLATGGEDNHVRVWMVYPNIRPVSLVKHDPHPVAPRPPRIEYLSTLSRHSAPVNVVRFSPSGELIASAGDDGMIIIWAPSANPNQGIYGSDLPPDESSLDKEFWKPRTTFRCTTMQVYDLAWSPTGEYIVAGSTDNTARVFASVDGKCVCELAEHSHFVQGVAWDPLNEYIATQSSDRSMHVYRISTKNGQFEAHAIGRNTRMPTRHARTPSAQERSRPNLFRRESSASDADSTIVVDKDENNTLLTPAASVSNTPSLATRMFPPPPVAPNPSVSGASGTGLGGGVAGPSSRRSSFSASSNSPLSSSVRYGGRSPSPMPPLPAIRSLPPSAQSQHWTSVKLYGDESYTNFFRRLTFSSDGALLLTPAGQFEDPFIIPSSLSHKGTSSTSAAGKEEGATTPVRGRKGRPGIASESLNPAPAVGLTAPSTSSVYIYSRANFARPPIAQLPGHKKASVAVRFSPILYELRPGVGTGGDRVEAASVDHSNTAIAAVEKGVEGALNVDVTGPISVVVSPPNAGDTVTSAAGTQTTLLTPQRTPALFQGPSTSIASPAPKLALSTLQLEVGGRGLTLPSPRLSPMDLRPSTPASKPSTPSVNAQLPFHIQSTQPCVSAQGLTSSAGASTHTASMFVLPYRMLFAVVTMDSVTIYDTQQAGPICLLTKLHYDEFTDMTWSPDGQCLLLSSRDGYCTIIIFDEILPVSHTQQHVLQLQSIAHQNFVPLVSSSSATSTPVVSSIGLPPLSGPFTITTTAAAAINNAGGALAHVIAPAFAKKRSEPPLTPAASTDGGDACFLGHSSSVAVPTGGISTSSALASGSASGHIKKNAFTVSMSRKEKRHAPGTENTSTRNGGTSDMKGQGQQAENLVAIKDGEEVQPEPPKKRRRVALTRVGDLDS